MVFQRSAILVAAMLIGLVTPMALAFVPPLIHDSWLRTDAANREHALAYLPRATMLQAADSCGEGHFHEDEQYGYWVQDFQFIVTGPSPRADFDRLLERDEPLARLYGLVGVSLVDTSRYAAARSKVSFPDTTVLVADRCRPRTRPIADLLPDIDRGYWREALMRRQIDVH